MQLKDWEHSYAYMYHVDKYSNMPMHQGLPFPNVDKQNLTGLGGLHFWKHLEDALEYVRENNMDHMYAFPRVQEEEITWNLEVSKMRHTKPTLVASVPGYNGVRNVRDEIVLPGSPPDVYRPNCCRITTRIS
jgi:hypothetical protein